MRCSPIVKSMSTKRNDNNINLHGKKNRSFQWSSYVIVIEVYYRFSRIISLIHEEYFCYRLKISVFTQKTHLCGKSPGNSIQLIDSMDVIWLQKLIFSFLNTVDILLLQQSFGYMWYDISLSWNTSSICALEIIQGHF